MSKCLLSNPPCCLPQYSKWTPVVSYLQVVVLSLLFSLQVKSCQATKVLLADCFVNLLKSCTL